MPGDDALVVEDLRAGYGEGQVLRGMSLRLRSGRVRALLGRNGTGKTTFVRCVAGVHPAEGTVRAGGADLTTAGAWLRARHGLALVPQGRRIFASLTVRENIEVGARPASRYRLDGLLEMFPALADRLDVLGGQLSGGEQQMLAIARALRTGPSVLLLDEPTEGLAPQVVGQLTGIVRRLAADGVAVLLVEQNLPMALATADDVSVLARGETVFSGTVQQLQADVAVQHAYLGV